MSFIPVILSGGSGTRLWPYSRKKFPKQFCQILETPLQSMTFERLKKYGSPILVTSQELKVLSEKNKFDHGYDIAKIIYEPIGKNTAPAVALACKYLSLTDCEDKVVGIFASDALIKDTFAFDAAVKEATIAASNNYVVTLGIKPSYPETGFGYIELNSALNIELNKTFSVSQFHEKPSLENAAKYISQKNYFWNAGIFFFKVSKMVENFKKHSPDLWNSINTLKSDFSNLNEIYANIKSISFDYAIIEKLKADEIKCVPCDMGWSDLGSWDSVVDQVSQSARTVEIESQKNSVVSAQKKIYGFVGVENLTVVDTADALLISKKGESQKVKELVQKIGSMNPEIISEHLFEHRPWGTFEILRDEKHFKSKIIQVSAGQKISYQSHSKRAEHWIIVKGEAVVVLNDQEILKKTGEHIFIPMGSKHRIINRTSTDVEFVEVQVGSYFGEDDIVRYDDDYGRV